VQTISIKEGLALLYFLCRAFFTRKSHIILHPDNHIIPRFNFLGVFYDADYSFIYYFNLNIRKSGINWDYCI